MQDFYPKEIFIDTAVKDLPVTRRILAKYPHLPVHEVADKRDIKFPQEHSRAKKQLYISSHRGEPIKSCQGMGDYVCCQYFTVALVSDCHLECTYCILQDYLKNNPIITVYANLDEIFASIHKKIKSHPDRLFRIGTGELSDSLALDHITEFSRDLVAFARSVPNAVIELKTKTANVDNLIGLEHGGRTVISWSINPEDYIAQEEHKCDTLAARLAAARRVADAGYPVAFHLDPLLHYPGWEEAYRQLITTLAETFKPQEIAWVSLGTLRFTKDLKKISQERFPKSKIMTDEFYASPDGKLRYFRPIREEMYGTVSAFVREKLHTVPNYLCMETKVVWQNVFGEAPTANGEVERLLTERFPVRPSFTV